MEMIKKKFECNFKNKNELCGNSIYFRLNGTTILQRKKERKKVK